jgi:predicted MFS family arabinose efflux permease
MITQSFLYNAIFFTYTLVLTKFYGVSSSNAPIYLIAFAVGNLAGPPTIGRLFDTIGAGVMILGGAVELVLGIPAERKPLEAVARPLSLIPSTAVPRAAGATTAFSPDQRGTAQE